MTTETSHKCEEKLWIDNPTEYTSRPCFNKAKYYENGRWRCGTHTPSRIEIRKKKRKLEKEKRETLVVAKANLITAKDALAMAVMHNASYKTELIRANNCEIRLDNVENGIW